MKNDKLAKVITLGVVALAGVVVLAKHIRLDLSFSPDVIVGYGAVGAILVIAAMDYRVALRKLKGR